MKTRARHGYLWFWCPGCDDTHVIETAGPRAWSWDGDTENPTISPSLLVTGVKWSQECPELTQTRQRHRVPPGGQIVCHSFIRAGQWEFLTDSTHDLAGQTVPMVDLPDWIDASETTQ